MSTQYALSDGSVVVKDDQGRFSDHLASATTPSTPAVGVNMPASTGKQGTDAPPLSVQFKGKNGRALSGRFYVKHPDDRERAQEMGKQAALDAGVAFPSITTVMGSLDKPALVPWAAGCTADAAEEYLRELQDKDPVEIAETIDMLLEPRPGDRNGRSHFNAELRAAHREKKDSAAVRGTEVHALCEALERGDITVGQVPEEYLGYTDAYLAFREEYAGMTFEATEVTVAGDGFMGTTDAIVEYGGKRYVLDLKTNAKATVYSSVGLQLAAAANATEIVHADGNTEPMPMISGGIAVGLNEEGKHQVFLFDTDRDGVNYAGFRASVEAWKWQDGARSPQPLKPGEF